MTAAVHKRRWLLVLASFFVAGCECSTKSLRMSVNDQFADRNTYYFGHDTGHSATLKCYTPTVDDSGIYWDDLTISNIDRNLQLCAGNPGNTSNNVCKLGSDSFGSFLSYMTSDSGRYECTVRDDAFESTSVAIYFSDTQLNVFAYNETSFQLDTVGLTMNNRTNLTLACYSQQTLSPVASTWYRNDMPLHADSHFALLDNGARLVITPYPDSSADKGRLSGFYMCEAPVNNVSTYAFVQITGPPWAKSLEKSYNVMEGETVTMTCKVEGEPPPMLTWKRNNVPIELNKRIFTSFHDIPNASLTVSDTTNEDDGQYVCVATSGANVSEAVVILRIRSKLAPLWPFLGIVAQLIVLTAVIYITEKRRIAMQRGQTDGGMAE